LNRLLAEVGNREQGTGNREQGTEPRKISLLNTENGLFSQFVFLALLIDGMNFVSRKDAKTQRIVV
jgi:hypothetical protein